jgi:hypothetical protein
MRTGCRYRQGKVYNRENVCVWGGGTRGLTLSQGHPALSTLHAHGLQIQASKACNRRAGHKGVESEPGSPKTVDAPCAWAAEGAVMGAAGVDAYEDQTQRGQTCAAACPSVHIVGRGRVSCVCDTP